MIKNKSVGNKLNHFRINVLSFLSNLQILPGDELTIKNKSCILIISCLRGNPYLLAPPMQ